MTAPINMSMANMLGFRTISLIGSAIVTVALILCGFGNTLLVLTLCYGVVAVIGICMLLTTTEMVVNQYFDKKRALANGIVFSGSSIGYFVFAPILSYVLNNYGLKAAFLAEAGVTVWCFLLGMVLKNPKSDQLSILEEKKRQKPLTEKMKTFVATMIDKRVVSNAGFVLFAIGVMFNYFALIVPLLYIPSLALELVENVNLVQTSFALTILGVCNLCGRLICGVVDKFPSHAITIFALASLVSGLVLGAIPHCNNLPALYTASGAYGLVTAPMIALAPSIMVQLVGNESFSSALCLNMFIYGMMSLSGKLQYNFTMAFSVLRNG